jgi:Flp pilus assembly protein TadD
MLDGDQMSPAAKLAFGRAFLLAPEHPAPPYYAGLAYVRAGDLPAARRLWLRAVALSPEGADYRRSIATQLLLLDRYMAAMDRAGR